MDYLLSEHCAGLISGGIGLLVSAPSWELVLGYEQEIRHEMCMRLLKGDSLSTALRGTWNNPQVKERHFTTPLALAHLKRSHGQAFQPHPFPPLPSPQGGQNSKSQNKRAKAQKAKGKGGGKGGGAGAPQGCQARTPQGKMVCFRFNDAGLQCALRDCKFVHVCGTCYKAKTPMFECSHKA